MSEVRTFLRDHRIGLGVVTAALVVVGGAAVADSPGTSTTVAAVVDGRTIDVLVDGEEQRVRLLNVAAPDECLADDAAAFLTERLPAGTEVDLEYDEERHDDAGNVLAGVLEEGSLVNEEVARAGLGVAVVEEPNRRFHDAVLTAQRAAEVEGLGLYSEDVECTVPAQVSAYGEQVSELEGAVGAGTTRELDRWATEAAAAAATGAALAELLDGDDAALPLLAYTGEHWTLHEDVEEWTARVVEIEETVATERAAEEERIEREKAERRAAEEAEREAEEAARTKEAARSERELERAARAQETGPGGGSASFESCTAARNAGAAPVHAGQAGYGSHLDRDGVGCE
ncbi:micrococcal nuclease [Georgenia satyanarayanai]|uniref:Micrococcal nuclease n=1 Tax=Georgenia satyanarayanai TaxID=860221 RepID=A0A2Y8ZZ49_9MICO|nr:excalibur calcium-binding domain-containing protein [Georgenia satyanarayanai]PYG01768.1 micrococcal nuclease [Georgenia satyanarayanai]SSA36568.1 micrococcal nuclease [Georgenia satyanarayanai]